MRIRTVFLSLVFCLPFVSIAQQAVFGFTAGATLSKMHAKFGDAEVNSDSRVGFTVGMFSDIPLTDQLSFQPALNFVQKGYGSEDEAMGYSSKATVNCLEVPLNFLFRPKSQKLQFFAGAGPSISYSISGKETYTDNGVEETYKLKFGNDPVEDDLRPFEFGGNLLTGIETPKGLLFAFNYNFGLSNIAPGGTSDAKLKSNYFGLKIGYKLKGKK